MLADTFKLRAVARSLIQGSRAAADPFARQQRHRIRQEPRLAAQVWDAKGPGDPGDYEDAAWRLKNGSCEDDEPSQVAKRAAARVL